MIRFSLNTCSISIIVHQGSEATSHGNWPTWRIKAIHEREDISQLPYLCGEEHSAID